MVKIDSKENFIRIVNQYKNLIFTICLKMTGDYFTAEDITQDTFISVYQKYETFDGSDEKAWICRIASNKCIDYLKSAERRSIATPQEKIPQTEERGNNPLELYENKAVLEQLKKECLKLPEPYCDIGIQYFLKGMSAKEIAMKNGTNLKTIQTQIYRTRDLLRKHIRKEDLKA